MSVSPFIQSEHTHPPDGEKKKKKSKMLHFRSPFGGPLK